MKFPRLDPRIYAAGIAVAVMAAGAISGAEVGSSPIVKRHADTLPSADRNAGVGEFELDESEPLPDHYPLVTPTGTVPVSALAMHGRLRNSEPSWWNRPEYEPLDADYPDDLGEEEMDRLAEWQPPVRKVRKDNAVRVHTPDRVRIEVVDKATVAANASIAKPATSPPAQPAEPQPVPVPKPRIVEANLAGATPIRVPGEQTN